VEKYVLDASVILKFVLGDQQEPDQEKALHLLNAWADGTVELTAPTLWQYEVGNFLGRQLPQEAMEKMDLLLNLAIPAMDLNESAFGQCFSWMKQDQVTFYDASYLAVAFEIEGTLITADESFVRKMEQTGRICLFKDFKL
jgi:predicted nucleic acid-binding protein